ncbi:pyruvate dehydrogenase (acetyl-transferring) E1 component subunit alpha [Streptomyces sp. NBC_01803]|uniref:pyruvate dehydrogenase (acetyl-transferring) E1 component subunit alpha n=1 Tax=Streptomyces sp. NBC_01803 TaxID=2975946 RepID=UPI002DDC8E38|nr:pyruvate dehydrogenase (acetyl-transferring) E1 component subunit alpha [Streptomyces sp. NBC_01803]WSA43157.1 pyruvate dehydrogenase (acetyl-transferring) E1 component subunit alpha [Streptomyces sp. NBC_01803]
MAVKTSARHRGADTPVPDPAHPAVSPSAVSLFEAPPEASEPLCLLTPGGDPVPHPLLVPEHDPDRLREMYRDMVMVRSLDAEATALQRQGELGLWTPLLGQEAAQVGSAHALRADDFVFPSYREHGVAWCRGVDPMHLLKLFRGVTHGAWDPDEHNFHLYTLVVGAHPLHATGYAMGLTRDGSDAAAVAYFGDGATSQGDVAEAFTFAAVHDAPVVFFCQNNQWAISEPTERQSRVPIFRRASGFGFPGVRVDGNDVLACLAVTRAALEYVRAGHGPVLIEAFTYRMGAHTTSDDPTRYRRAAEVDEWRAKDPIERLRTHLIRTGHAGDDFFSGVAAEAADLTHRVRREVRTMPSPGPEAMFDHVYADGHALVDEERARYAGYRSSFAEEGE